MSAVPGSDAMPPPRRPGARTGLGDTLAMLLVSALSLMVLLYVAHGTARDGYKQLVIERVQAQGRIIQSSIDAYLRPGLPLNQYVGFSRRAETLAATGIADVSVYDSHGALVFTDGATNITPIQDAAAAAAQGEVQLHENATALQVVLPLRNRFESVGSLILTVPRRIITEEVNAHLGYVGIFAAVAVLALSASVLLLAPVAQPARGRWLNAAFATTYLAVAGSVVVAMAGLYSGGSQAKGEVLVASLGQRLKPIADYRLNLVEIDGIDRIFAEYRRLNPEVSEIALTIAGIATVHTDDARLGKPWSGADNAFQYTVPLTEEGDPRAAQIHLAIPRNVVYGTVLRSVKNFAALFVASALFATLFLQMARSIRGRPRAGSTPSSAASLALVRPLFFLAIFIEHLSYAFLPQFVQGIVRVQGLPPGFASVPFIAYYLCFALVLIPAGRLEPRVGPRRLIVAGMLLAAVGLAILPSAQGLGQVLLARMLTGGGQGLLFIGVQSYILGNSDIQHRTRGASIIVVGFQGGMISGMAIGSLLVGTLGEAGMFMLAGVLALLTTAYALWIVPGTPRLTQADVAALPGAGGHGLLAVVADAGFLRTIGLIGIPAKAVLTGVLLFGMPLVLTGFGYHQEDIGQVTMLYAGAVIAASAWVSRRVDQRGRSEAYLLWGSALTAAGLLMIASMGWHAVAEAAGTGIARTAVILLGVVLIGVAHGLINAPILTYVGELDVSARCGGTHVAATYRLMERVGHALGPMVVGQLLVAGGNSPAGFAWLAAGILVCGLLFSVPFRHAHPEQEAAR